MKLIVALLLLQFPVAVACFTTAAPYSTTKFNSLAYSECKEEFLVSIGKESERVTLSILATINGNDDKKVLHLAGQKLLSDTQCGKDNFRCKNPPTIKNTLLNSTVAFVPLHNALLLAGFVLNDTGVNLEEHHLINFTRFNCSPVTFVKILCSVYTICLNKEESYLGLFEIRLNSDSLARTSVIGPLARNYFSIQNSTQISEFKYIELYNFHFIYFAYTNYLYYFDPLNYVLYYAGPFHPNCTSVKEFVCIRARNIHPNCTTVKDDALIGCCREGATICFDLNYQSWTFYHPYSIYSRPFICPDHNKRLILFLEGGYVQFSDVSESKTIRLELIGENFVSGECFGDTGSGFYFVCVDQQEGTFILDLSTFNFTQLSAQPCFTVADSNLKCIPFQVLDNQYLIFTQQQSVENNNGNLNSTWTLQTVVLNAQNNFQVVTTISEITENINLVAVIPNNIKSCPSTAPIVDTTTVKSLTTNTDAATTATVYADQQDNTFAEKVQLYFGHMHNITNHSRAMVAGNYLAIQALLMG